MTEQPSRREFLRETSIGAVTLAAASTFPASEAKSAEKSPPRIRKAVKLGMVSIKGSLAEKFQLLKDLGYDGVEVSAPNSYDTKELLNARDAAELPIHGVVNSVHWRQPLSHPDPKVRAASLDGFKQAIQAAKDYEASSVLLVPAVVSDSVSYKDAYERSHAGILKALPLAEKLDIRILFENVWNNFLLSPLEMASYIDSFDSPLVGAYFDVGNIVRYGWPTHWVEALGHRIGKLDVKEYSRKLQNSKGPRSGFGVEIGEGDCDWPGVMQELNKIGYSGWATAEVRGGDKDRLADIKSRMDKVLTFA